MAEYLSPGVYVEEFDSGIKAMEGVGTSTAGFVGMAEKGPVKGCPVLVTGMADYQRRFGGYLPENPYKDGRFLPYAVEQFFNNGGSACYVMRVCNEKAVSAKGKPDVMPDILTMTAANPGAWGNGLRALLKQSLKNKVQISKADNAVNGEVSMDKAGDYMEGDLVLIRNTDGSSATYNRVTSVGDSKITFESQCAENTAFLFLVEWNLQIADATASEQYESVSFNERRSNYIMNAAGKSELVSIDADFSKLNLQDMETGLKSREEPYLEISFSGGSDGEPAVSADLYIGQDGAADKRTGIRSFEAAPDVSIMAVPGVTDKDVQGALVAHCEKMKNRFAILDMPLDDKEVSDLLKFRENVDSSYAAMYHPWLLCYDSLSKKNVFMPPSGAAAGIYARTDTGRGVHKAPANEVVRGCTGLSIQYNDAEQGKLNPKGVNLIRSLPGQGIRIWGARTCSSDGNWKYINVRRLFIFLEESIRANTNWAVFEPNDEMLWSRVEGTIRVFLTTQWRNGALAGSTADEAFYINIGKSTMTQDDILNGRLICEIGVAPVRPAEFVIFRITQKMETAQ